MQNVVKLRARPALELKLSALADKNEELASKKQDSQDAEQHSSRQSEMLTQFHSDCDFLLSNFKVLKESKMQEIEAVREAQAILSGMQN